MGSLLIVIGIWFIIIQSVRAGRQKRKPVSPKRIAPPRRPSGGIRTPGASAVPNQPKQVQRTREEAAVLRQTERSRKGCTFKGAYSEGRPERIGRRADYEPGAPSGMVRVKCAYCGAESFVPAGTREHYHCHFCWEKL